MAAHLLVHLPANTDSYCLKSARRLSLGVTVPKLVQCVTSDKINSFNVISRRTVEYKPPSILPNRLKPTGCLSLGVTSAKVEQCAASEKFKNNDIVRRRSADYKPCIWDKDYLQSLQNNYVGAPYEKRVKELKTDVKIMMKNLVKPLDQLELIHVIQRLGLAYHFEEEINEILENFHNCGNCKWEGKDLHETALGFRLLRQHGYNVPQDVFKIFLDKNGSFNKCIQGDIKGILSLYEASYYSLDNERIMEEAWVFTSKRLKELQMKSPTTTNDQNVTMELVNHAFNMPLHWRIARLEARWYIDVYEKESGMNPVLLELAKLDFNIVQSLHQQELGDLSRQWKKLGLGERLSFARDRLVEAYLWGMGTSFIPQDGYCRKVLTNATTIVTIIDDIYDVHGTLDELLLFTEAVERWDLKSLENLPDYMKITFLALFNMVNEIAYDILKEQNLDVLPHLKKGFLGLITRYLNEARWYHTNYKPTFEEYINNGWISIAGPLMDVLAYISSTKAIKKEALEFLESGPEIVQFSNIIFRLCDDFGTSTDELKRGDVPKAIQCHMYEEGASEEVSREYMRELIRQTWKKVNRYRAAESPLPKPMVEMILNISRTSHMMYQYGDGHGNQEGVTKNIALALLVEPIPL